MTVFEESKLRFEFDETWSIFQFDKHPDLKLLNSPTPAAIDFLGEKTGYANFLFEIKNFAARGPKEHSSIVKKIAGAEPPIVETIEKKVIDSLLSVHFLAQNAMTEQPFWQNWQIKLDQKDRDLHVIFWLELDAAYPKMAAREVKVAQNTITSLLKKRLRKQARFIVVADVSNNPLVPSLSVSF